MKKLFFALALTVSCLICVSCGKDNSGSLVGMWEETVSHQIVSFTADGYYYEGVNESFTADKTKYKATGNTITYYIENQPGTEFSVDYTFDNKGNLVINNVLTYEKIEIPQEYAGSVQE